MYATNFYDVNIKKIIGLLTILIVTSCRQQDPPAKPDMATLVAGNYQLTYLIGYNKLVQPTPTGSLVLGRLTEKTVEPTFQIEGFQNGIIDHSAWTLTQINSDSIHYQGPGYYSGIKNGQIDMAGYGDGVFFFRFTKK